MSGSLITFKLFDANSTEVAPRRRHISGRPLTWCDFGNFNFRILTTHVRKNGYHRSSKPILAALALLRVWRVAKCSNGQREYAAQCSIQSAGLQDFAEGHGTHFIINLFLPWWTMQRSLMTNVHDLHRRHRAPGTFVGFLVACILWGLGGWREYYISIVSTSSHWIVFASVFLIPVCFCLRTLPEHASTKHSASSASQCYGWWR